MIPELGCFSIIFALFFALLQATMPLVSLNKKNNFYFNLSITATFSQFLFLIFAMLLLILSFINNDLTVLYVREHSHLLLPFIYKIGAAWGGHEGSLLLWCLILSGWTVVLVIFPHRFEKNLFLRMLMILGLISAGFILFLLLTSNPFKRDFPTELINGNDLTPILQDPGLIFHPPMLYIGYVGFAIAFAFAIAVLMEGQLKKEWARECRPWIIVPWAFLGCGIVLGSWWAYRELGWGGWWFWDPVENASLLPWLSATALLHSLIVSEKRESFQGWTILLAIITFALSLIGTFLVRSGILVSVHAFSNDPSRGLFLLIYLALIIFGSFILYSFRLKNFYKAPTFNLLSRETFLLLNSIFLLTCVATIVLGTLYPIFLDALNLEKISIGEPYFNTVFLPIIIPLLLLMGVAPHVNWGKQTIKNLLFKIKINILLSIFLTLLSFIFLRLPFHTLSCIGLFLGFWIITSTLEFSLRQYKLQGHFSLSHSAMIIAHIGIAIIVLGITINKTYSEEKQIKIQPGEITHLAGYDFIFQNLQKITGPNYKSITANFTIQKNNKLIQPLSAEQRIYSSNQEVLSKPGVTFNMWRDLYLALGTTLSDGSWSVRIYYKPLVRWIWVGGFMMLIGGALSILNYWRTRKYV